MYFFVLFFSVPPRNNIFFKKENLNKFKSIDAPSRFTFSIEIIPGQKKKKEKKRITEDVGPICPS